jgi:MoaA/NifB/PqqE/SkfB family radical SAM enzyme/predicted SAM-dependent methyltransferase
LKTYDILLEETSNPNIGNIEDIDEILVSIDQLIINGQYDTAEDVCKKLLDLKNEFQGLFKRLGIIYFKRQQMPEAQMFLKKELNFENKDIEVLKYLALIYLDKGDSLAVLDTLLEILIIDPNNKEVLQKINEIMRSANSDSYKLWQSFQEFENSTPAVFTIETALACNLRCPECAIGSDAISSRAKGYLKFDKFKIIADKIRPYVKYLYLHLWGEPMLNKEIFKMIEYSSKFTKTNISTNANIVDEEVAEKLILSGVSDIIVSIDGMTQNIYEKYRVGGDVEKAKNGLKYLTFYNNKNGNKVNIIPQFIVFKHNQHEMEDFRNFCSSLGLQTFFKAPYIRYDDSNFAYADNMEYHRAEFSSIKSIKDEMRNCVNPRNVFTMNIDGSVIICCHDYNKHTNFGNIFENNVLEIWNNPKYREFRWNILKGAAPAFCLTDCQTYKLSKDKIKELKNPNTFDTDSFTSKEKSELPNNNLNNHSKKINLCSGTIKLPGYINIDICQDSDIILDLEKDLLPFPNNSIDTLVCISAINYFSIQRGQEIINEVYRVLKPGGIARFGTQDLEVITEKYLNKDKEFYFQKSANGADRFKGRTIGEKLNEWFYGYEASGKKCKYVYDFETLALLFTNAGFVNIENKQFLDSKIKDIDKIDNRPEQMFFLEAEKLDDSKLKYSDGNKNYGLDVSEKRKFELQNHLLYAINWLKKSHDVTEDGGSSAMFYLRENRWHTSYPETTGYLIPTFLNYSKLYNDFEMFDRAVQMGDWEISIQRNEGGIGEPANAKQSEPRVFNTAQVLYGFLSLYQSTLEERFLQAAIKAGDWIVTKQNKNGSWHDYTHDGENCVHARTALPLYLLGILTGDKKYSLSAEKFVEWALEQVNGNGWFNNTSINTPNEKPWTHLIGYVLQGLYEISNLTNNIVLKNRIIRSLEAAADAICNTYDLYKSKLPGLPGTLDCNWKSDDQYTCITGNAQIAIFLAELRGTIDKDIYTRISDQLTNNIISVQLIDNIHNDNLLGGLTGSYPVSGGYCPDTIPNWGVKFFSDLLILKLNDTDTSLFPC